LTRSQSISEPFEEIALGHLDDLYRAALRLCGGDSRAAERLVEDAVLDCHRRYRQYAGRPSPRLWLLQSLFRASADAPTVEQDPVLRALDLLPRPRRDAVLLVDCLETSSAGGAEVLGLSPEAFAGLLAEGRRDLLKQPGIDAAAGGIS